MTTKETLKLNAEDDFSLRLAEKAKCVVSLGEQSPGLTRALAALAREKEVSAWRGDVTSAKTLKNKFPQLRVSASKLWEVLDDYRPRVPTLILSTTRPSLISSRDRRHLLNSIEGLLKDSPRCLWLQSCFGLGPPFEAPDGLVWAPVSWRLRGLLPRRTWSLQTKSRTRA